MCQNRVFFGKKRPKTLIWCKKTAFFGAKKNLFFFILNIMRSFLILWVQMDFFCPDGTLCADFSFLDGNFAGSTLHFGPIRPKVPLRHRAFWNFVARQPFANVYTSARYWRGYMAALDLPVRKKTGLQTANLDSSEPRLKPLGLS